ncbi:MAG: glycosyltransferase family 4 protein [Planctomycetes bacterium]|nr:glycosyltransferase family 4 protein [Planctomycetota bacterium]
MITTRFGSDRSLPDFLPRDIPLDCVDDSRNRGGFATRTGPPGRGVQPLVLAKQVRQIKQICETNKIDILHLYGATRTAYLAAILKMAGLKAKTAVSLCGPILRGPLPESVSNWLLRNAGTLVASTRYMREHLRGHGVKPSLVRHGCVRDLRTEDGWKEPRHRRRVLYWRDPTLENGVDIAIDAFRTLAPKYPDVTFTMAVRPVWQNITGIDELPRQFPNIEVHRFPYKEGVTLAGLMSEALCVFMPFRNNTFDPQMVILESLEVGVPVIASDQQSNNELVLPGFTGELVPPGDSPASVAALDRLLADRDALLTLGRNAESHVAATWNWSNFESDLERVYSDALGR